MSAQSHSRLARAWDDLRGGIDRRELWLFLGWRDVRSHYRRTVIGPLWLTLSMGMMVLGLGILYSEIFQVDVATYLPNLAVGLIGWGLINGLVVGACDVLTANGPALRQVRLPLSVHLYQFVWGQLLTFAHNFVIYIAIVFVFAIWPSWKTLLFFPAIGLVLLNGVFVSMILGPLCARYRDVPLIISSVMQIAFFMTPIIWSAERMPKRALLLDANPFYHFIEIVRDPLLGRAASLENWTVAILLTGIVGIVAVAFFARYRARVVYWS